MKAILKINEKEIEVEISEEELEKLKEKKSPFKRVEYDCQYYFIDSYGCVNNDLDKDFGTDIKCFNVANYCTDKDLIQQQAYRETLNRLLWRWQYENDEPVNWELTKRNKFKIAYNHESRRLMVDVNGSHRVINAVYFSTREKAEQAIKEIVEPFIEEHPDFVR